MQLSMYLVHPESHNLLLAGEGRWFDQQAAQYHTCKVPQVEDVVRLCWSRQEVAHSFLVHIHSGRYYHGTRCMILGVKILTLQMQIVTMIIPYIFSYIMDRDV